ncbi:hypothetical protein ACFPAF_16750 [Hymenobacter endophyticus]|uniref:Tail fiber protein n=1 Tax=Hymenobacter endophyticus TaxID=3076335 RepID=A0ABU3TL12_9BACT|nr:hypothetical protein [Hymenobacter endophyticus]MDU0372055.1 hypothetical protein [Hymenobacter endophyticus]
MNYRDRTIRKSDFWTKLLRQANDLLARSLGFTMTYKRPDFTGRVPKVKDIVISPAGCYTCRGSIVDLKIDSARVRPSLTYAMTCERKIFTTPQKLLGTNNTYVRASEALIKIETDMGVYSVRIPPIYSNPELNANVGEIIASMLSPEQFTQAYGLGWVLADGRAVPENSRYKSFVGPSVPDLRGVFLRGRNYNRDPNTGNPDNDKEPGAYQADELKSHDHGYALYNDKIPRTGGSVYDIWRNDKPARTTATGGLETRPRNVTVNYYIKID